MSFRFRQRVRICPGIYLNISGGGLSVSAGVRGASVTVGPKGAYVNAGIPGTGISYRQKIGGMPAPSGRAPPESISPEEAPVVGASDEIKSAPIEEITGGDFAQTKEMIANAYSERERLRAEIRSAESAVSIAEALSIVSKIFIFGFFIKWFRDNVEAKKQAEATLQEKFDATPLHVDVSLDQETRTIYEALAKAFELARSSERIWDVTSSRAVDNLHERTVARSAIDRVPTSFSTTELEVLKSEHQALALQDPRGPEILIYPAFIVVREGSSVGVLGFNELELRCIDCQFQEEEGKPSDSKQVGTTWKKANKDGGPDRRFKGNYPIPIMLYAEIILKSGTGLNECFMVSNRDAARTFADALAKYQKALAKTH